MSQVSSELYRLGGLIEEQNRVYEERRKVDDARETAASRDRDLLLERVNNHGQRQTIADTRWEAFFGPQGAFRTVVDGINRLEERAKASEASINKGLGAKSIGMWLIGLGVAIIIALFGWVLAGRTPHAQGMISSSDGVTVARY